MTQGGASRKGGFGGARDVASVATNAFSLAILATAGLGISTVLAYGIGTIAVGQFNQLLAIYIVASQLAAGGIHLSCLHYLSHWNANTPEWNKASDAALLVVTGTGAITALGACLAAGAIERVLASPNLANGIMWLAPAIWLTGTNKVILSLFNSTDKLHSLAAGQTIKPLIWLIGCTAVAFSGSASPSELAKILSLGEAVSATLLFLWFRTTLTPQQGVPIASVREWIARHLRFGLTVMPSHLIVDLNTRVDVLILGLFASDSEVGIYSFAALLAEGVLQVSVVFRTVIARRLVKLVSQRDQAGFAALAQRVGKTSLAVSLLLALFVGGLFLPAVHTLDLDPAMADGMASLFLLLAGIVVCSRHTPMWMTLALAGRPKEHSVLMLALLLTNILLNFALVPQMGMLGSAIGTAAMFAMFPFMLSFSVKKVLGLSLQ